MKKILIAPPMLPSPPLSLRTLLFAAFCAIMLFGLWPTHVRADHITIELDPPLLEVDPGITADVQINVQGGNEELICLDAFIEAEVDITFKFASDPCHEGDFSATLHVSVGPDVPGGTYEVGIVSYVMEDDFPISTVRFS